jgi:hypothetical protein
MAYAFTFDAYNKSESSEDSYGSSRVKAVDVTVIAETEAEALAKTKELLTRDYYLLEDIVELVSDGTFPVKSTRW